MSQARFGRMTDAPATFLLVGARIIDPSDGTDARRELAVVDGVIADSVPDDAERIDGHGLVVTPGLCDLHAHLRDPGGTGTETVESGSRAAARGGFTTITAMPNTDPPLDSAASVADVSGRPAACRVRVIGAATSRRAGKRSADLADMAEAGAVGFSDDGAAVADPDVAREVLAALAPMGLPLVEHAEDPMLAAGGVMRAGPTATRLGLPGWSPEAEISMAERDIALAAEIGARVHLTHLSTAGALEAVRRAKARGAPVTCDVTPHHLAMTDAWVAGSRAFSWEAPEPSEERAYDGRCRVNPPLASREDALALLAGLGDGTIDAIATDHAPHPRERTLVPFGEAAPGLIGLETALSLGLAAVQGGLLDLATLMAALSTRPASIIGERRGLAIGAPADLVAFDLSKRWRVEASELASASANTPLLGQELPGVVRMTVAAGRVTYRS